MYKIEFTKGGNTVTKTAKNEAQVRRLVYLYGQGTQQQKEAQIQDVLTATYIKEEKKITKQNKTENDVNL
jgi:hypothetical protein